MNPKDKEELIRMINAPLTDPLTKDFNGFDSTLNFERRDLISGVQRIQWASRVGAELRVPLTMQTRQVSSWSEAHEKLQTEEWDSAVLEAQNQLTIWLTKKAKSDYSRWNEHVSRLKPAIMPIIPNTGEFAKIDLRDTVDWCILNALMANEYLYTGHRIHFFLELFSIFEDGKLPCGWEGEWPSGQLVVF